MGDFLEQHAGCDITLGTGLLVVASFAGDVLGTEGGAGGCLLPLGKWQDKQERTLVQLRYHHTSLPILEPL